MCLKFYTDATMYLTKRLITDPQCYSALIRLKTLYVDYFGLEFRLLNGFEFNSALQDFFSFECCLFSWLCGTTHIYSFVSNAPKRSSCYVGK